MTIKVALAGAGAFGIKHLDAIKLIDGVEVVSLVSRELDKTKEVAAQVRHRPRHHRPGRQPGAEGGGRGHPVHADADACRAVDRLPERRQARAGGDPAGRFAGRRRSRGGAAEEDRPGGDVRPHPPLQPQPPVRAPQDRGRRIQHPADGRADLLLPPHQHERAGPAAQLDRPPAVAPRRAHGGPVRLPGGQRPSCRPTRSRGRSTRPWASRWT